MTDQLNGLRFDIYERVHLPDDVAAIEELEEIELVPHMQALPQDDQVLLRGHLLLSGVYRSEEGAGLSQLEHWIPVEIALPNNRIQSMEDLAVEIDNFDVDLLNTRSLNVTGVLALRGLEMQAAQSPVWRDDSFTVVHQAEKDAPSGAALYGREAAAESPPAEGSLSFEEEQPAAYGAGLTESEREDGDLSLPQYGDLEAGAGPAETKESGWLSMFQQSDDQKRDSGGDQGAFEAAEDRPEPELADPHAGGAAAWGDLSGVRPNEPEALLAEPEIVPEAEAQAAEPEEKADVRIALGGKPLEAAEAPVQSGVGLLSQLGEKGARREAELRQQESALAEEKAQEANQEAASKPSGGDELEWTRLFLNNGAEANTFRKVKICIVQKEETLDSIADRYNLQPRELQLYNRLQEPYLSEGQVLYIP
ncbi:LysM peptidoglycan-binding domain-containing protein [Paenibacillaceae bacterium WGS1546]|uniref:LysM peptidoglycan-binding domain-containing protein n=1 Tax=Cohnella sp. WGS1546 TaxID=3366810 RepID=UPI00372CEAEE